MNKKLIFSTLLFTGTMIATAQAKDTVDKSAFYDAALCKPAYTATSATDLYYAAEELAKADSKTIPGAAIYTLTEDIGQDGFKTKELFFATQSVGVFIEGLKADELAKKYNLAPEKSNLAGAATKSYARELPDDQQPEAGLSGPGKVSIIARESSAIPGKTLLACEFVSDADLKALEALEAVTNK
jgi:hypothetical protein